MSLFRRKPIALLIATASADEHSLKKSLTFIDLIALGVGAIIGAGIFAILGTASSGGGNAPPAGPGVIVSIEGILVREAPITWKRHSSKHHCLEAMLAQ